MRDDRGLLWAYILDGRGGARAVTYDQIRDWSPEDGALWVHLDRTSPEVGEWLERESGLEPTAAAALLEEETRPRCYAAGNALLVLLRGVNLNPGADPEDMVSIRMWFEPARIITLRRHPVMAMQDLRDALEAGRGPTGPAALLTQGAARLVERILPVIGALDEELDTLEESIAQGPAVAETRQSLGPLRRQAIALRRYLAPQREALSRLQGEPVEWIGPADRARLREVADATMRYVEDLDAIRERAAILRDEIQSRLSEDMNRTMYVLSVVAAFMLPLGFITGLLGINVGGMPGMDSPWAFAVVCAGLVALGVAEFVVLRRLKWL